jgi:peroxiredoxin
MKPMLIAAFAVCSLALSLPGEELANRRAPGFSLMDINYNQHDIADYRGRVVIVEFMRTDCPVCQEFTGVAEKVKAKFGDRVAVLTIVNTPPDNQQTVMNFIQTYKVSNPVLFDCFQVVASYLKVTPAKPKFALPHLFLVDGKGQIRKSIEYLPDSTHEYFTGEAKPLMEELGKLVQEINLASR